MKLHTNTHFCCSFSPQIHPTNQEGKRIFHENTKYIHWNPQTKFHISWECCRLILNTTLCSSNPYIPWPVLSHSSSSAFSCSSNFCTIAVTPTIINSYFCCVFAWDQTLRNTSETRVTPGWWDTQEAGVVTSADRTRELLQLGKSL